MFISSPVTPEEDRIRLLYRMRAHPLFWRMVSRQGVNLAGRWWLGQEAMLARAVSRCAGCAKPDACEAWLTGNHRGRPHPSFCPNGAVIGACRIMDPDAPPPADAGMQEREPDLDTLLTDPLIQQLREADRRSFATRSRARKI